MLLSKLFRKLTLLRRNILENNLKIYFEPRTLRESLAVNEQVKHLLVVGLPRSGTSFLQRLLNSVEGIFVSYESIYQPFISPNSIYGLHAYYYEIIKQYQHLASLHGMKASGGKPPLKPFTFLEPYLYFGDKVIYQHSSDFRKKLRKAISSKAVHKVIFIVRDPRDRMLSYFEWTDKRDKLYTRTIQTNTTSFAETIAQECRKWNEFVTEARAMCLQHPKCILLKYEDLVSPDTGCFRQILTHLEIQPTEEQQAYYDASISDLSVNKWKANMEEATLRQINALCGEHLEKLSYELPASS